MVSLVMLVAGVARADNVDTLIGQLKNGGDRERLAAALGLVKLGDPKAILPLAGAVIERNESSDDVRETAADGLAKLVNSGTSKTVKGLVIKNLQDAEANDSDGQVKSAADASLSALGSSGGGGSANANAPTTTNATGVYVNVGPMSSKTTSSNNTKIMKMMNSTATSSLRRRPSTAGSPGPGWPDRRPATSLPSAAGFYVDGTMTDLIVKISGGSATVTCKVSMLLAAFPSKSMFGFPNGGASVQTGSSQKDIDDGGSKIASRPSSETILTIRRSFLDHPDQDRNASRCSATARSHEPPC